jgi:hypothetical protein
MYQHTAKRADVKKMYANITTMSDQQFCWMVGSMQTDNKLAGKKQGWVVFGKSPTI